MNKHPRYVVATMITIMMISIAGCAEMRSFGKFVPDDRAKIAFETYQINPDYRYYIIGSDVIPIAIIALHKSFTMGNDLCKEVQLTPDSMKETVTFMQMRIEECCHQNQFGFLVYDGQGKQMGILYSFIGAGIAFQVDGNGVVKMHGPQDNDQLKTYLGQTRSR